MAGSSLAKLCVLTSAPVPSSFPALLIVFTVFGCVMNCLELSGVNKRLLCSQNLRIDIGTG